MTDKEIDTKKYIICCPLCRDVLEFIAFLVFAIVIETGVKAMSKE